MVIAEVVRSCWSKAGAAQDCIVASTAYTNVLIHRAIRHLRDFVELEPEINSFQIMKETTQRWTCDATRSVHQQPQQDLFDVVDVLNYTEKLLSSKSTPSNESPSSVIAAHNTLVSRLVTDLLSALDTPSKSDITRDGLPGVEALGSISNNTTARLTTCIIFYLLSVSHCAYSEALAMSLHVALPRISALKLANEALSTIRQFIDDKSMFPCQCTNTLSYRVAHLRGELEAFAKFKCWNTLMQSPLVAGNHVLEILDQCSYYGMHLLHYRHYVGAVLHTYNTLVHLKALDSVYVLEEICNLFAPVLYSTGVRPESGFMASWLRYIGARLKFKTEKRRQNHKETWCMSVPGHAAARFAGLNIERISEGTHVQPKFDYGTIDSTMKLKHHGWALSIEEQEQLDRTLQIGAAPTSSIVPSSPRTTKAQTISSQTRTSQRSRKETYLASRAFSVNGETAYKIASYTNVNDKIFSTFNDNASSTHVFPPSRFNLLSFFRSMTKVISGISDATHSELSPASKASSSPSPSPSGQGQMCLCFTQTILRASDRILDARRHSRLDAKGATWSKNEKESIECFKNHLMAALNEAGVLEGNSGGKWIWESVM